ncbi:MAG: diacylglycerol kinase family lipid kinase [Chloroflexota bacterium]|jgi:YegS/Rv2252/BmrU family lipid kinase
MRALIVLNPVAGRTKATVVRQAIDRHFKENEWQITVHETKAGEPVGDIVGHQIESGLDVVIAAGGDGTVSAVINGMANRDVPLGILPTGTTNAIAQELKIPANVDDACQLITGKHRIRAIDALQVKDDFYALSVGIGLDARAMENTSQRQKRRFGKLAYIWVILKLVLGIQPETFTLIADGELRRVKAADILMTNVSTLTRPFRWGPHIVPDDGQIDIIIMRARNLIDILGVVYDILVPGRPRRNRNLRYWSAQKTIQVFPERPLPVQGDGELLGIRKILEVQVWTGAVGIIVPAEKPGRRWSNLPRPSLRG